MTRAEPLGVRGRVSNREYYSFFILQVSGMLRKRVSAPGWTSMPWKKRRTVAKSKVSSLTRQVRAIRKSQEVKNHDVALTSVTGGDIAAVNSVPLGDSGLTRDGRKITMKKLQINITASGTAAFPRYVVVYDKVTGNQLPQFDRIFATSDTCALPNPENLNSRFKILYDNFCGLGKGRDPIQEIASGVTYSFCDSQTIYLKNLETTYGPLNDGSIGATATGGLYIVFLGTTGTATANIKCRLSFIDS